MRLTRYFLPILRENPAEAQITSHRLMLRAGMIRQAQAGIYSWLPLGFKVLSRLEQIVHEEQQRAGLLRRLKVHIQTQGRRMAKTDAQAVERLARRIGLVMPERRKNVPNIGLVQIGNWRLAEFRENMELQRAEPASGHRVP